MINVVNVLNVLMSCMCKQGMRWHDVFAPVFLILIRLIFFIDV